LIEYLSLTDFATKIIITLYM